MNTPFRRVDLGRPGERLHAWLAVLLLTVAACTGAATVPTPVADPTPAASAASGPIAPPVTWWHPRPGLRWQIQYSGRLALNQKVDVFALDGQETPARTIRSLKAKGRHTLCYVSAGSYEAWRPDTGRFPRAVRGRPLDGWHGEYWLDIRRLDILLPILADRFQQCADKGFDAVDPDNIDGWQADSGFPLTRQDAIAYVRALSAIAHARGLAIGLKNGLEILGEVAGDIDFAVNEECLTYHECGEYRDLLAAGKAVFHVEYTGSIKAICAARPAGFATVRKHLALGAWARRC